MNETDSILEKPIRFLKVSTEFKVMAQYHDFSNLHELLEINVAELLKMRFFGYRMLRELYHILLQNEMTDRLD